MTFWKLNTSYSKGEVARFFADLDSVFALRGEPITKSPLSEVLRVTVNDVNFYVKRYTGAGKNILRRWVGRPRVQAEWENLQAFHARGIPTARLAAFGLERRFGAFIRGALITEEIPRAESLAQLAGNTDARLRNRHWLTATLHQLALMTRQLHQRGFAHNDLKWRNILVNDDDPPKVFLIDCPCGAHWRGPLLRRRIIKDLACLDKGARHQLTRTQRLRFYLDYAGHKRLTAGDKKRIALILRYFKGRE